jgi:hypothetical protein
MQGGAGTRILAQEDSVA